MIRVRIADNYIGILIWQLKIKVTIMDQREMEIILAKLLKVGSATCEACGMQAKFSEIDVYNGSYLCPDCMRKITWAQHEIIELQL